MSCIGFPYILVHAKGRYKETYTSPATKRHTQVKIQTTIYTLYSHERNYIAMDNSPESEQATPAV